MDRRGQWYLSGIGFVKNIEKSVNIASPASPLDIEQVTASPLASPKLSGEASGEARKLTQKAGEAGEAVSSPFAEICNLLSQLTDNERQKLAELLIQQIGRAVQQECRDRSR